MILKKYDTIRALKICHLYPTQSENKNSKNTKNTKGWTILQVRSKSSSMEESYKENILQRRWWKATSWNITPPSTDAAVYATM